MSIIESIKNYLTSCPDLNGKAININYLSSERDSFSIDNVPKNPVVKRYSDGESLMQFCFVIAGRTVYDRDTYENMRIAEFFEDFESWIARQNSLKNLPNVSDLGLLPIAIEVTKSGTVYDTARTSARFQIEARLLYRKKN